MSGEYSYCEECGHKIHNFNFVCRMPDNPFIPPGFPKWVRPDICGDCSFWGSVLFGCSERGLRQKLNIQHEKEEEEILKKFRRWENDKSLKELEPDWLEYCIRRYTF